ncbi:MAG TPA: dimethylamine monooxygenase subunit DmmA family protein [Steroidobacteraceae bacterium]|nr:dimethylamine monooxygenase subunit DmmA family protein [Steroidobacteraceae bacterium]
MLITGIKSKPVYAPLRADVGGRYHLMLGIGPGGIALLRVLAEMRESAPQAIANARLLFVPEAADATDTVEQFKQIGLGSMSLFDDGASLLDTFRTVLAESFMGTRLYVAGPESFIGLAMKIALEFDLNKDEIRAEEIGTLARRVYCVHCRTATEEVRTNIVRCTGCARWLLVRDHYSRRLAAYMGVMVDAEAPGELPPLKEIYL